MRSRLLVLVLGLQLALFLPSLLRPGVMGPPIPKASEVTGQTLPWHEFWRDEVRAGRPPFWNPYMFGGTPMIAEPQTQTFYPAQVLWLVLSSESALKVYLLLHLWLGAWLMYRLVRELGGTQTGAAFAALAYGAHGQMIVFAFGAWVQMLAPMAWAPGVIWQTVRALRYRGARSRRAVALASVGLGLQILGGHPEWVRYTLAIAGVVALMARPYRASLWQRLGIAMAVVVLGMTIGGLQLAPLAQAVARSNRGQAAMHGVGVAPQASLPLLTLPAAVVPRIFGPWDLSITTNGAVHQVTGATVAYGETLIFVGVLPLLAALLIRRRRDDELGAAAWIVLAVAGVVLATNNVTHAQTLLDRLVPFDAAFRSPGRWVFLTNFSLCVLGGLGVSSIASRTAEADVLMRRAAWVAGLMFVSAGVLWAAQDPILAFLSSRVALPLGRAPTVAPGRLAEIGVWAFQMAVRHLALGACVLLVSAWALRWIARDSRALARAMLLIVLAADLGLAGWPFLTSRVRVDDAYAADRAIIGALSDRPGTLLYSKIPSELLSRNAVLPLHVRALFGYQSFRIAESLTLSQALDQVPDDRARLAAATHVLLRDAHGDLGIAPLPPGRPRAWFTSSVRVAADADAAIDALLALPATTDLVVDAATRVAPQPITDPAPPPEPQIIADDPGRIHLRYEAPRAGWIVLHESFYPGWQARVNGQPARLVRAFGVVQAIEVPAGHVDVDVEFRPAVVWIGAGAMACGLLIAAWLACHNPTRARASKANGHGDHHRRGSGGTDGGVRTSHTHEHHTDRS